MRRLMTQICRLVVIASIGHPSLLWAADELPRHAMLPLALASQAAMAAVEKCRQDGYRVSAAVVDRGGVVKALLREDGAGPHTTDSATKKAYTAASLKRPTTELADLITRVPTLEGLRDMSERILILGGGLPIEIAGDVVGGIGVGGAPGTQFDDACARARLERIGAAASGSK